LVDLVSESPVLRFEDLTKSFGQFQVLRGLNLSVARGQITVIIGRSGAGKSVAFKHALGLLRPDSGRVWVNGQDLTALNGLALRDLRLRFGMVFQNSALFDSMTVFDNVAFPLREHSEMSETRIAELVREVLFQVGLQGAQDKMPAELSGGMRKRAGLARALIHRPEILLYDEPTTGLDPILTAQINRLILQTQQSRPGITSVIISHDLSSAFGIADKIAFLHEGKIIAEGPPQAFQDHPDPRVQQFVEGRIGGPIGLE
jgi:phospholipid/cholesterol/gamma-HCH transport system ATP-binding protein